MISNANSAAVQNKHIFFSWPAKFLISYLDGNNLMAVGHCLRDHGTETKNNFDSMTRSLKLIDKRLS